MAVTLAIEGPLAPWASGMSERLENLGYKPRTAARHMQMAGQLSRFLQRRGMTTSELTPEVLGMFVRVLHQNRKSRSSRPTPKALEWLVSYLRGLGVVPMPVAPPPQSYEDELCERFRYHLVSERGLLPETAFLYVKTAGLFLADHRERQLCELSASDVSRFMTKRCRVLSVRGAERLATSLRSFLRFAFLEGLISAPLEAAVPSTARWSGAGLPRGLTPKQVRALLASCDRRTAIGRRDYAVLVLISRLGLRAAEVAALSLEDIDWRRRGDRRAGEGKHRGAPTASR